MRQRPAHVRRKTGGNAYGDFVFHGGSGTQPDMVLKPMPDQAQLYQPGEQSLGAQESMREESLKEIRIRERTVMGEKILKVSSAASIVAQDEQRRSSGSLLDRPAPAPLLVPGQRCIEYRRGSQHRSPRPEPWSHMSPATTDYLRAPCQCHPLERAEKVEGRHSADSIG